MSSPQNLTPVDIMRTAAIYGLDLVPNGSLLKAGYRLNTVMSEITSAVADTLRTNIRRGVRGLTGNQRLGQGSGDIAYLAVLLVNPLKLPTGVSKVLKIGNAVERGTIKVAQHTPSIYPTRSAIVPPQPILPQGQITNSLERVSAFELKHNKKAVQNMTDHELSQSLANRAERKMPGGKGPEVGKLKHKYTEKVFKRYQNSTGQRPEIIAEGRFKGGREWEEGMGLQDSVKPDFYNKTTKQAFDYKFGEAEVAQGQRTRYEAQLPRHEDKTPSTLTQIKPSLDK